MTKTIVYAALISGIAALMILYGTASAIPTGDSDFVVGAFFKDNISKELIQSFDKQIVLDNYDFIKNNLLFY
jgi:hypothetical protein